MGGGGPLGGGTFLERKVFLGERKVTFGRIAACYPGAQDVDVCVYNVHHVCACVCVVEGGGGGIILEVLWLVKQHSVRWGLTDK